MLCIAGHSTGLAQQQCQANSVFSIVELEVVRLDCMLGLDWVISTRTGAMLGFTTSVMM